MKTEGQVTLKRGASADRPFHPWIYKSQIASVAGSPEPGSIVKVRFDAGPPGVGYYNPSSEIAVRILSRRETPIDADFVQRRLAAAADYRRRNVRGTNSWRAVSSEADGLPGLIVDKYGEALVVQFLTFGMERLRPLILDALDEIMPSRGIFERSDSSSRRIEGLPEKTGWIRRECGGEIEIVEGDIRYSLRLEAGHKTGHYLDQRENRELLAQGQPGEALDAFCYEGGFGLHLARAGWKTTGIDIGEDAIRRAEENRKRNGISEEKLSFKIANVFDELKALDKADARFDLVILDPPSFVKKKAALEGAITGYKELLLRSMKIVKEGGRVAVFSCSYHVDDAVLMHTSLTAAMDVRKSLRVLRFLKQSLDHPIDPFVPETYYLKGFLFEVSSL